MNVSSQENNFVIERKSIYDYNYSYILNILYPIYLCVSKKPQESINIILCSLMNLFSFS